VHPFDIEHDLLRPRPHLVTGSLYRAAEVIDTGSSGIVFDGSFLGRQVDVRRFDTRHALKRPLHVSHAGRAVHSLDLEDLACLA
jgi:hypothetical protein